MKTIIKQGKRGSFNNKSNEELHEASKTWLSEIDFISGAVSKIAKGHGIETPLNDLMYKMIKIKEGMFI